MKIGYTFTTSLEEMHEVLFDKLRRVQNKTALERIAKDLNTALISKKELSVLRRGLTDYMENLAKIEKEVSECLSFVAALQDSLENMGTPAEKPSGPAPVVDPAPQEELEKASEGVALQQSLASLGNFAKAMKNMKD